MRDDFDSAVGRPVLLGWYQTADLEKVRPRLKVWKRTEYVFREPKKEKENVGQLAYSEKAPASESRLAEMSLMVDTGGTYVGDDARLPGAAASVFDPSPSAQQATPLMNGTAPQKRSEDTSKGINLGK